MYIPYNEIAVAAVAAGRWESCYLLLEWSATPSAWPINICRYAPSRGEGRARIPPAAAILISHLSSTTIKFKMSVGGVAGRKTVSPVLYPHVTGFRFNVFAFSSRYPSSRIPTYCSTVYCCLYIIIFTYSRALWSVWWK